MASFVLTIAVCPTAATAGHALESAFFALLSFAVVGSLRVLQDIWCPTQGAYNAEVVLDQCVAGLDSQLDTLLTQQPNSNRPAGIIMDPPFQ